MHDIYYLFIPRLDASSYCLLFVEGSETFPVKSLFMSIGAAQKFTFTAFNPDGKKYSAEVIVTMEVLNH